MPLLYLEKKVLRSSVKQNGKGILPGTASETVFLCFVVNGTSERTANLK